MSERSIFSDDDTGAAPHTKEGQQAVLSLAYSV